MGAPSTWRCARAIASSTVRAPTTRSKRARAFAARSTSGFCAPTPSRERGTHHRRHGARRPTRPRAHRGRHGTPFPSARTPARTMTFSTWTTPGAETAARCDSHFKHSTQHSTDHQAPSPQHLVQPTPLLPNHYASRKPHRCRSRRAGSSQHSASIRPTVATADFVSTPTSSSPTTRARAH
jgi:hypothetical protein